MVESLNGKHGGVPWNISPYNNRIPYCVPIAKEVIAQTRKVNALEFNDFIALYRAMAYSFRGDIDIEPEIGRLTQKVYPLLDSRNEQTKSELGQLDRLFDALIYETEPELNRSNTASYAAVLNGVLNLLEHVNELPEQSVAALPLYSDKYPSRVPKYLFLGPILITLDVDHTSIEFKYGKRLTDYLKKRYDTNRRKRIDAHMK